MKTTEAIKFHNFHKPPEHHGRGNLFYLQTLVPSDLCTRESEECVDDDYTYNLETSVR